MAGLTPELTVAQDPRAFVDGMGATSSHPRYRETRRAVVRWMGRASLAVLAGGVAFVVWNALSFTLLFRFSAWMAAQEQRAAWVVAALGFLLAMQFTLAVQVRMSEIPSFAAGPCSGRGARAWRLAVALLALLFVAAVVPYLGARFVSGTLRFTLNLVAVLLLPLLLVYVEWADEVDRGGSIANLRLLRIASAFAFGIAIATLLSLNQWIADLLSGGVSDWLARRLGALPWSDWVAAGSGSLTDLAPSWLRDSLDGRFGEPLRGAVSLVVKEVTSRLSSGAAGAWAGIGDTFVAVFGPILRALIRLLLVLTTIPLVAAWLGFASLIASGGTVPDSEQRGRGGLFARLFGWIWRIMFGRRAADPAAQEAGDGQQGAALPDWTRELRSQASAGSLVGIEVVADAVAAGTDSRRAPTSGDESLRWMFDGHVPSEDQRAALEDFRQAFIRYAQAAARCTAGKLPEQHPDIFLQADPGAGASSSLRAMAIEAAVVRGQRVVLLCGSDSAVDAARAAIQRSLESMMLDGLVLVGGLRDPRDRQWCKPAVETSVAVDIPMPPDIIVATMLDWDRFWVNPGFDMDAQRAAILSVEVMLVDDFSRDRGGVVEPMHLPFVVGRQRLLLATESRPFQLVVATPVLEPAVAAWLATRLFGWIDFLPSVSTLRRWGDVPTVIDVTARRGELPAALDSVVSFLLSRELKVLIYHPSAGDDACEELRVRLGGNGRPLQVVSDRDRLPSSDRAQFDAVVYRRSFREEHALTISARLPDGQAVYLRLHERGVSCLPAEVNPMPVLASLGSRDLVIDHLRRLAPFIESGLFVDRRHWTRFGLDSPDLVDRMGSLRDERFREEGHLPRFIVDPPYPGKSLIEGVNHVIARDPEGDPSVVSLPGLDHGVPDNRRISHRPDGSSLVLGAVDHASDPRRFLEWLNQQKQSLDPAMDLAHLDRLLKVSGASLLRPRQFREVGRTDRGAPIQRVEHSERHRGMPDDGYIPIVRVVLDLEPHALAHGPEVTDLSGTLWFWFQPVTRPIEATVSVIAIANERLDLTPRSPPIEFTMDASVSAILVDMPIPQDSDMLDRVRAMLSGRWRTEAAAHPRQARAHWPTMTRVINAALRAIAPELPSFGRFVAFRPPRGGSGCCVFLIEPIGTGGTVKDAVSCIFSSRALRERFCALAEQELAADSANLHGAFVERPEPASDVEEVRRLVRLMCGVGVEAVVPWTPTSQVGIISSPAPVDLEDRWVPPRVTETEAAGFPADGARSVESAPEVETWEDYHAVRIEAWRGDWASMTNEAPVTYGVAVLRAQFKPVADELNEQFGYVREKLNLLLREREDLAHDYLRSCGMLPDLTADYRWIVNRSTSSLQDLATRIIDRAESAGATSIRAKVAALYSFVIACHDYELIAPLPDNRDRWGVRVPADMLACRKGDCDSACVLLLSLMRAARIPVRAGVVVTHDHALVGVELPITPVDDHAVFPEARLVLLECTERPKDAPGVRRIGRVARQLVGTAVQLVGFE